MTSYVTTSECLKDTMCESPPGGCCSERCLEAAGGIAPRDIRGKGESVVREPVDDPECKGHLQMSRAEDNY